MLFVIVIRRGHAQNHLQRGGGRQNAAVPRELFSFPSTALGLSAQWLIDAVLFFTFNLQVTYTVNRLNWVGVR